MGNHFSIPHNSANNQGTIKLSNDNKFHVQTKHVDIHYHSIQEALENKVLDIQYVPTDNNIADIFTKGSCQNAGTMLHSRGSVEIRTSSVCIYE